MSTRPGHNVATAIEEPLFYQPRLGADGDDVLSGEEARHVTVQRLRTGDAIALFNGQGDVARGTVQTIGRRELQIRIEQRLQVPEPRPHITLYTAVPKGERFAVLLDMATQLGVSRITPVQWRRSIAERGSRAQERWRRICVEACKQSRRLHVPIVADGVSLHEAMTQATEAGSAMLVAHRFNPPLAPTHRPPAAGRLALFVGPEGGITPEEAEALQRAGAQFVQLGAGVLRIETAAVALIAIVMTTRAGSDDHPE